MKRLFFACGLIAFTSLSALAQTATVTISGIVKDAGNKTVLPFVNITLNGARDSAMVAGTISGDDGRFKIEGISIGNYVLTFSYVGYEAKKQELLVGELSNFLDLGTVVLSPKVGTLGEVTVAGTRENLSPRLDKKTFSVAENISQAGGSILEAMKNLPGITVQEGSVQLRGSDKVMILIDGKQTALTGSQSSLENIPASAIEKIEIINNPSAKYDANANPGIINIIFKKEKKEGLNGKIGISTGAGALWIKRENLPDIRPQYQVTPKINPSVSLNYRKNKVNIFFQGDNLYTHTLNKNEFVDRYYDNGDTIRQQTKRNRNTNFLTLRSGIDWFENDNNTITVSALFGSEKILDHGDEPFFDAGLKQRQRLWQFLEDELKTTVTATAIWQHKFKRPGRLLSANFNYTFHREDEKYFFTNVLPGYTGLDSFALISDEHVADLGVDYVHPLRRGRFETGMKFRRRYIPVNMKFKPGLNSPLDVNAGGWANYSETIPAIYGNYVFESNRIELEAGIRLEYVHVEYDVNPGHPVYKGDRYSYFQPFGSVRFTYKLNEDNRLSAFYTRRVDRPNEVDIRIFPKYDDAEIIKVGNPALRPQFSNNFELGYKKDWNRGYFFSSVYHKRLNATIIRIGSLVPGSTLIYNIFQNAGKSYSTGLEMMFSQNFAKKATLSLSVNAYKNIVDSFTVLNKYPQQNIYHGSRAEIVSGNAKFNAFLHFSGQVDFQLTAIYQAADLMPQGKIFPRFSVDAGAKKIIQGKKGELFVNATDIANTLQLKREVNGNGFRYASTDYNETQVFRIGYNYKF
jgi:outer membrane receptor protein involved in Fe transport